MTDYCFNCDAPLATSEECIICGYSFSLGKKCVRLINKGIVCINTNKICREKNWENCKILRTQN